MGMVKRMILELEDKKEAERLEQEKAEEEFAERILSGDPIPIPCDPMSDGLPCLAWELFTPAMIQPVIEENRDWLEVTPRSTQAIIHAIFPRFIPAEIVLHRASSW